VISNDHLAELQAADLKARIQAHDYFLDINVIVRDDGDPADAEAMALGFMTPTGPEGAQKQGACVIIEQPEYVDQMAGVKDGPMRMNWTMLAVEHRLFNKDTANGGTGKRALAIARRLRRIVRGYHSGGLTQYFSFDRISRVANAVYYDEAKEESTSLVVWRLEFHGNEGDHESVLKVAPVIISPREGDAPQTVTLTCATSGAAIYYTLDGTYPWSGNEEAEEYTAPIEIPTAALLRACAFKDDYTASDVAAANFT
jgi:hypothetical protein